MPYRLLAKGVATVVDSSYAPAYIHTYDGNYAPSHGWMDGWMDGLMNGWRHGWTVRYTDAWMDHGIARVCTLNTPESVAALAEIEVVAGVALEAAPDDGVLIAIFFSRF